MYVNNEQNIGILERERGILDYNQLDYLSSGIVVFLGSGAVAGLGWDRRSQLHHHCSHYHR